MTTIKFEKEINDCRECPFYQIRHSRNISNRHGNIPITKTVCQKIGDILEHNYEVDDIGFEIPKKCPFNE